MQRLGFAPLFGTADLPPGSITLDCLNPGSVVLLHGGIFHARRKKPGGRTPRYFVDVCYMEAVGSGSRRWPAYRYDGRGLKTMAQVNAHAKLAAEKHWNLELASLYDLSSFDELSSATPLEHAERVLETTAEAAGAARERELRARSAKL